MKRYLLLLVALGLATFSFAQNVGIGTTTPDASAKLDVTSTDKGVLIPRMTMSQRDAITSPATGLLIYQTDNTPGFYYYNGTVWTTITSGGWLLTGNAGTNPSTDFIGTTDSVPLTFRVNNLLSGKIDLTLGNASWGYQSLLSNIAGSGNTATGNFSLNKNTEGKYNTADGTGALYSNISGNYNTANGNGALNMNTTGNNNTANGAASLALNTSGHDNIAFGMSALFSNTTGYSNVAIGTRALYSNVSGNNMLAIGDSALFFNEDGTLNTAIGNKALYSNTTGENNTAIGVESLSNNTIGTDNTAIGIGTLYKNTAGYYITAIGVGSLDRNTTGYVNTSTGVAALANNTTGSFNTANGYGALGGNSMGSNNTAIGLNALLNNTVGNENTALGYEADMADTLFTNATAIGAYALAGASNTMVLGSINGVHDAIADVNVGIGTNTPDHALEIAANSSSGGRVQLSLYENDNDYARLQFGNNTTTRYWHIAGSPQATAANSLMNFYLQGVGNILSLHGDGNAVLMGTLTQNSDMKLKTNILPISHVLSSVLSLNGYRYQWKDKNRDQSIQIGLLAQEVQQYFPELVKQNDKGILGVNYSGLVPVVIEAMKEQEKKMDQQEKKINQQKEKMNQQEKVNQSLQKSIETLQRELEILKQQIAGEQKR